MNLYYMHCIQTQTLAEVALVIHHRDITLQVASYYATQPFIFSFQTSLNKMSLITLKSLLSKR